MVKKYGNRNYSKKIKRNRKNIGKNTEKYGENREKKYDKNRDKTGTIISIVFLFFLFLSFETQKLYVQTPKKGSPKASRSEILVFKTPLSYMILISHSLMLRNPSNVWGKTHATLQKDYLVVLQLLRLFWLYFGNF